MLPRSPLGQPCISCAQVLLSLLTNNIIRRMRYIAMVRTSNHLRRAQNPQLSLSPRFCLSFLRNVTWSPVGELERNDTFRALPRISNRLPVLRNSLRNLLFEVYLFRRSCPQERSQNSDLGKYVLSNRSVSLSRTTSSGLAAPEMAAIPTNWHRDAINSPRVCLISDLNG
jgi:hypothetical protein